MSSASEMAEKTEKTISLELIAHANNHLAVHLHSLLAEGDENVFFSPFSISTAMAMVYYAAKADTKTEMSSALGYSTSDSDQETILSEFQQYILNVMKSTDSYTLSCANSLLIQKDFEVKEEYKKVVEGYFNALLLETNFQSDIESLLCQINNWVKEKTSGMIPNFIQSLDSETAMLLLNAVYFKGSWLHQFNEKSTFQSNFYNHGKEEMAKTVDMMEIKENFPYAERDSFQALQLSYNGGNTSMLILLPKTKDGLKALEKELSDSFIRTLIEDMRKKKVTVNFPRFSLRYSKSLVPYFRKLGISRLFKTGAQLGGASESTNLVVSNILHEAVLEVNEEGSKAAAVTKIAISVRCAPRNFHFTVNHPFLFAIYDKENNIVLFLGRVVEL